MEVRPPRGSRDAVIGRSVDVHRVASSADFGRVAGTGAGARVGCGEGGGVYGGGTVAEANKESGRASGEGKENGKGRLDAPLVPVLESGLGVPEVGAVVGAEEGGHGVDV